MPNWNEEDFTSDPPEPLAGGQSPAEVQLPAGTQPLAGDRPPAGGQSDLSPQLGNVSTRGVSAEETFRRLAELHRQMLEKQYNNAAFRSEIERIGVWIRSMDVHLVQLAQVETLAEQHRALLNDMMTKAQDYRQVLLNDMSKHQKTIDDALKSMGNPLKKLDDLLEEQTRSFQSFSIVVHKIWWIFLSAALSGALIGNLFASFLHV